jgi:hypothetical protein
MHSPLLSIEQIPYTGIQKHKLGSMSFVVGKNNITHMSPFQVWDNRRYFPAIAGLKPLKAPTFAFSG